MNDLPEAARFCNKCGKAVGQSSQVNELSNPVAGQQYRERLAGTNYAQFSLNIEEVSFYLSTSTFSIWTYLTILFPISALASGGLKVIAIMLAVVSVLASILARKTAMSLKLQENVSWYQKTLCIWSLIAGTISTAYALVAMLIILLGKDLGWPRGPF